MNAKNIKKVLDTKLKDWISSIDDPKVQDEVIRNAMVTGGAIVSLLLNEEVNDYDIYFKTKESCRLVAAYYMNKWNTEHPDKDRVVFDTIESDERIRLVIGRGRGNGMVAEDGDNGIDDDTEPYTTENEEDPTKPNPATNTPKYRPRFFSTNAISLSDKIQIVIRFYGSVEDIHKNFDYEHTKCCYDHRKYTLDLPAKALECILNKELIYSGSKYPLTSIIRSRKFITRGWTISAGQYVKMAFELNELDLKNIEVFKDQVVGVDSAYFMQALDIISKKMEDDPTYVLTNCYLFEVIDRIF